MNPEDHPLIQAYLDVVTSEKALAQAQERFAALSGSQAKPAPKAAPKAKRAPSKAKAAPKHHGNGLSNSERVCQALGDYPDGASVAKLADDTGLPRTAVSSALQALGKRDAVRAISRGVYALATPAEPTNGIAHAEMT